MEQKIKDIVFKICLSITGSFEGASWGGSNGNFDGAGTSAFILQWNFLSTLKEILIDMHNADIDKFKALCGDLFDEFAKLIQSNGREGVQNFITNSTYGEPFDRKDSIRLFTGGKHLKPEYSAVYKALGNEFIQIQMNHAEHYFNDAIKECQVFRLNTERSVAFIFDYCVQRGRGNLSPEQQEFLVISKNPNFVEDDDTWLKHMLEEDKQRMSKSPWAMDSYSRRSCILNDGGVVHGRDYDLGKEFGLNDAQVL